MPEPILPFKHDMYKLPKGADGVLATLQTNLVIDLAAQTPAFIDYDTRIRPDGNYPLGPGLYNFLLYTIPGPPGRGAGTIFTTLRKHDHNSELHYRSTNGAQYKLAVGNSARILPSHFKIEEESPHECNTCQAESNLHAQGGV